MIVMGWRISLQNRPIYTTPRPKNAAEQRYERAQASTRQVVEPLWYIEEEIYLPAIYSTYESGYHRFSCNSSIVGTSQRLA